MFLANRDRGSQPSAPVPDSVFTLGHQDPGTDDGEMQPEEGLADWEDAPLEVEGEEEPEQQAMVEIGGNTFAEIGADTVHIPSVVTFGGVPAAMDGDLVYLGGGLYASAASQAPAKAPHPAPKRERSRIMPGRVRPGKSAAVSGGAARSSQSSPSKQQLDEYGFVIHVEPGAADATPA